MSLEKGEIENPAPTEKETPERVFNLFKDEEGLPKEVRVKRIGTLDELMTQKELGLEKFPNAPRLVEAFSQFQFPATPEKKDSISRQPHFVIVGGFVRDFLLGKNPKDIDFATNLSYEQMSEMLNSSFQKEIADHKVSIVPTGEKFGILRVVFNETGEDYEIAMFREDAVSSDSRRPDSVSHSRRAGIDADRRDLTINGLIYNPTSGSVIDYVGGLKDIKEKTLRFVGNPKKRLEEDLLRSLRYLRFLKRTDFSPDANAKQAIQEIAGQINKISPERIRDEINTMFIDGQAGKALKLLREYGLLKEILPEVESLADCPQGPPYHMEGDVFTHTTLVCNSLEKNTSKELLWAAVFHDISKPETRSETTDEKGDLKVSFLRHEEVGAEKTKAILKRLKFSAKEIQDIVWLIENHIKIFSFPQMKQAKARKFAMHPLFSGLMILARADHNGSYSANEQIKKQHQLDIENIEKRYQEILVHIQEDAEQINQTETLLKEINGLVIIERAKEKFKFDLKGKEIGQVKNEFQERIVDENIIEKEIALEILDKVITEFLSKKS